MALAGHDAADGDKGGGAEAEFVGTEDGADENVAGEAEATVDAERNAGAKAGAEESFVGVAQTNFPGQAGIFDRCEWGGAGSAVVTTDGDDVCAGFGDAGGDYAD